MSHPIPKIDPSCDRDRSVLYIHTYGLNVIRGVYKALMLLLEEMGVLASDRSMVSLTLIEQGLAGRVFWVLYKT
jgi:hypothetical protein